MGTILRVEMFNLLAESKGIKHNSLSFRMTSKDPLRLDDGYAQL